jgi:hypothetical protein
MKKVVLIIMFVVLNSCFKNKDLYKNNQLDSINVNDSVELINTIRVDWSESKFLEKFIDSIKNSKRERIPSYLLKDCFDYQNRFYWDSKHNPSSLRKKIIFSLKEIEVVEYLLENKDLISDKICDNRLEGLYGGKERKIDSQDITNVELLKMVLSKLKN